MTMLPPGSTIGILGGGQLGRMLALAAARLGFDVAVLERDADSPAGQVEHIEAHMPGLGQRPGHLADPDPDHAQRRTPLFDPEPQLAHGRCAN